MRFPSPVLFRSANPNPSPTGRLLFRSVAVLPRFVPLDLNPCSALWPVTSFLVSLVDRRLGTGRVGDSWLLSSMSAVARAAEESSPARRFWNRSKREAVYATYTPFVVCLAAGNLELECFRNYIAQDVHFLKAYAKAYEMAEECADDDDAKDGIIKLKKAVLDELKMHDSIVAEWGIDPTKEIAPIPATTKYTDFLSATAAGKIEGGKGSGKIVTPFEKTRIAAYAVGAMTPWIRLYSFLGKELQLFLHPDGNNHVYKKWIDSYASETFTSTAEQIDDLLDKLCVTLTGEELEVIEKLYLQAMKLEAEIFSTQPIVQPIVVPLSKLVDPSSQLVVFSDFDLTCTVVDSSAILAEIAILTAPKAELIGPDYTNVSISSLDLRNSWDALSRQYTEEYEQCIESILQSDKANTFDHDGLYKALAQLSDFEKRANSRVVESGLLRGMNLDDIRKAGERLSLQEGCRDFFQKVITKKEKLNADIHILSYCWCADLIRSAFSSGALNVLKIHSNEFEYKDSFSTGEIMRKMETPFNKIETFSKILSSGESNNRYLSVFIGDSVGDLLCLLEADVGIVIGSSVSLRKVGEHFGVSFVPLFTGLVAKQKQLAGRNPSIWRPLSGVLYTVSSWSEIQAFILGN